MATDQRFTKAFSAYLAGNKGPEGQPAEYGISADGDEATGAINLTLIFKRGVRYCCAEPGCHLCLHRPDKWLYLRRCLSEAGISPRSEIELHLKAIVEEAHACGSFRPRNGTPTTTRRLITSERKPRTRKPVPFANRQSLSPLPSPLSPDSSMNGNIVQVDGVHKFFRRGSERLDVLNGVTLDVPEGEFLGLMGPSGSGKTTLLNLIAGPRHAQPGRNLGRRPVDLRHVRGAVGRLADAAHRLRLPVLSPAAGPDGLRERRIAAVVAAPVGARSESSR